MLLDASHIRVTRFLSSRYVAITVCPSKSVIVMGKLLNFDLVHDFHVRYFLTEVIVIIYK